MAEATVPIDEVGARRRWRPRRSASGITTIGHATVNDAAAAARDDARAPHRPQPEVDEGAVLVGVAERCGGEHEGGDRHEQREAEGVDEAGAGREVGRRRGRRRRSRGAGSRRQSGPDDDADGAEGEQGEQAGPGDLRAQDEPVEREPGGGRRTGAGRRWRSSALHQVAEDALEVVVERGDLVEADVALAGDHGDRRGGSGGRRRCRRWWRRRRRGCTPTTPARAEQAGGQRCGGRRCGCGCGGGGRPSGRGWRGSRPRRPAGPGP